MGNSSSGHILRGSSNNLNAGGDSSDARARHTKEALDRRGSADQPALQQEATEYDMPHEDAPGGEDVATALHGRTGSATAASGKGQAPAAEAGLRRGSAPAAVAAAGAGQLQEQSLKADSVGGSGKAEPTADAEAMAAPGRRLFGGYNKSKKKSGKNDAKSKGASLLSESEGVGPGSPAASERQPRAAGAANIQQLQRSQPDLMRSESKESSSSSKGSAAAGGIRVLPALPTKPAAVRSASADQPEDDPDDDDDGTYDRLQRDVHPSKVRPAAQTRQEQQQQRGSGGRTVAPPLQPLSPHGSAAHKATIYDTVGSEAEAADRCSSAYEAVYPDRSLPSVALAPAAASRAGGAGQVTAAAAASDDVEDDDDEGGYDFIQRDVNPVRAKQLRMQTDGAFGGGGGGSSSSSAAAAVGAPQTVGSAASVLLIAAPSHEDYADDDNSYDCIQRDVNPVKAKQDRPMAVEYSLPQATRVASRDTSLAYETIDLCASGGSGGAAAPTPNSAFPPAAAAAAAAAASSPSLWTMPGLLARAGAAVSVDADDSDDAGSSSYDRIQRDVNPSKVRQLKDRQQENDGLAAADGSHYTSVNAVAAQAGFAYQGGGSSSSSSSNGGSVQDYRRGNGLPGRADTAATPTARAATRPQAAAHPPPPSSQKPAATAGLTSFGRPAAAAAVSVQSGVPAPADLYSEVKPASAPRPLAAASGGAAPMTAAAQVRSPPPSVPPKQFAFLGDDVEHGGVVKPVGKQGASPASEHHDQDSRSRGPALQTSTLDMAPTDTDADQRRHRVNHVPYYENVSVDPRRADATDDDSSFDSSSAFYANDQSLRGSQQPPMLTASPPLPRGSSSAGRGRLTYAELDQPRSTVPTADWSLSQRHQPKLHPANEPASTYSEIDFAVGPPPVSGAMPASSPTQHHLALHTHSTQDGLSIHEAGSASPASQLNAPRKKPWVPQRAYQDVDDVRDGLA